jgi:hypothetical protein
MEKITELIEKQLMAEYVHGMNCINNNEEFDLMASVSRISKLYAAMQILNSEPEK